MTMAILIIRKHLIGTGSQFDRFSPIPSWYVGRHDAGEVSEFYIRISRHQEEKEPLGLAWASETSKPHPSSDSSKKVTPPNLCH